MGGGTPRAIARIEVRAIGSAMWLVRCCCRQRPHRIPAPALDDHGDCRGSSCRRARCRFDHRTWRAAEELLGTQPSPSATHQQPDLRDALGQCQVCTRLCTMLFVDLGSHRQGVWKLPSSSPAL
jgi:hypothetical protein